MWFFSSVLPQPESSEKSIGVVAGEAVRRQLLQLLYVAPAKDHFLGFKCGDEIGYNVRDMASPAAYAHAVQPSLPDVVFIGVIFVRQMAEFHRLDDAIHDHPGPQTPAQPPRQQLAALVAPKSLHG